MLEKPTPAEGRRMLSDGRTLSARGSQKSLCSPLSTQQILQNLKDGDDQEAYLEKLQS